MSTVYIIIKMMTQGLQYSRESRECCHWIAGHIRIAQATQYLDA